MEKKNDKKTYETPTVELLKFDNNDVITTSGFEGDGFDGEEEDEIGRGDRFGGNSTGNTTPDVKVD